MPAKSPDAVARKAKRKAEKQRRTRRAASTAKRIELKKSDWPCYKIAARNMRPRLPEMTKAELRAMLAQACQNTVASEAADA